MARAVSADEVVVLSVQEVRDMLTRAYIQGHDCAVRHATNPLKECNGKDRTGAARRAL